MLESFDYSDKYNKELVDNTHPSDWVNPKPKEMYNLVVIGAGTAGLITSIIGASLGAKVALVERSFMGGDCLNVGCVPSKTLIKAAHAAHTIQNAHKYGITPTSVNPADFTRIMEGLRKVRAGISVHDSAKRYSELGVDVFFGNAYFSSETSVKVDDKELFFKKAVIATGARAVSENIRGLENVCFYTNEDIFNLTTLPKHLLIVGAGPIGCELAQSFRRLGSEVSVVQRGEFLAREDADARDVLLNVFEKEGINMYPHSHILESSLGTGNFKKVVIQSESAKHTLEVDAIFVAAGRAPNVESIGLETAKVEFDPRKGIIVNDYLQTSNKKIYAAGDCCMKWQFTHAADAAAQIVVQNALFAGRRKLSSLNMPWCTYTDPEIAHVGMYEREAIEKNIPVDTYSLDMDQVDRAVCERETQGFVKIMVKKGTDKILGATIVGSQAGELISEISVAMAANMGLGKLSRVIHPYPTKADAIRRVAGQYNKTRLTPFTRKILGLFLKT